MKKKIHILFPIIAGIIIVLFLLWQVFTGHIILPQTINLGLIRIHIYGIFIAAAAVCGWALALKRSQKYGIEKSQIDNIFLLVLIFGFIGARLYHVVSSYDYYLLHFSDIFKVWNGGLGIYGALIGGIIGLWFGKKLLTTHYSFLTLLDCLAPSLLLGQVIGRFGNLFNYELYGYPTNLPWKMFVPQNFRDQAFLNFQFFHPLFLYEALGNAIFLLVLLQLEKKRKLARPGELFFSYILLYNILRFFLEFLRIDSTTWAGIRANAVVSLVLMIISVVGLIYLKSKVRNL